MSPGSQILCADGSIVLEVLSTNPKAGTVRAKCLNHATLGCGAGCAPTLSNLPLNMLEQALLSGQPPSSFGSLAARSH